MAPLSDPFHMSAALLATSKPFGPYTGIKKSPPMWVKASMSAVDPMTCQNDCLPLPRS
jgi:hypothetical protein